MFFKYATTCLAVICGLSSAALLPHKRDTQTGITLYAYGEETNGAPVFYHDGLAYVGESVPSNWTGTSVNVTITADSSDTTVPWTITSNSSSVTFNSTLEMYIIPTSGSFSQVGFASSAEIPTGGVTTGFAWFGTSVAYAASESDYELLFWAAPINDTGVWGLYWNAGGTILDDAFPVVLKNAPPAFPSTS